MKNPPLYADARRRDQMLPRILAAILFTLAGLMGLLLIVGTLTSLASGRWGILAADAVVGSIVAVAWWVARLLWSGRPLPIPGWVVGVLLAVSLPIAAAQFIMMGQGFMAFLVLPWALPMLPALFSIDRRKPSKPKGFEDFE